MSFSWREVEEEESKVYDTKGTVTISTEEYRDLLAQVYKLRAAGQKEHDDWYQEYNKRQVLENQVKDLTKKMNEVNAWLDEDGESKAKFKLWRVEQLEKIKEDN